jgi:hypothetical protein
MTVVIGTTMLITLNDLSYIITGIWKSNINFNLEVNIYTKIKTRAPPEHESLTRLFMHFYGSTSLKNKTRIANPHYVYHQNKIYGKYL